MNIKPTKEEDLIIDKRIYEQLKAISMPSLYEALVELITNVDDSYERLALENNQKEWSGKCRIEYKRGGQSNPSILSIKDRAEGMSFEKLRENFRFYAKKLSGKASRGYAGRGGKDVAFIGDLTIHSNFNGKYSKAVLTSRTSKFQTFVQNSNPTKEDLDLLGLKKNQNGSCLSLKIDPKKGNYHLLPKTIIQKLPLHYALQFILDNKKPSIDLIFADINKKGEKTTLVYTTPKGKLVHEESYFVNDYKKKYGEKAKVYFKLFKSEEQLDVSEQEDKRFRKWGISIVGKKACHEKSLLDSQLDNAPEGKYYFGVLKCELISLLLEELDYSSENKKDHDKLNPFSIIDLNRVEGLDRRHPFTKLLLKYPSDVIKKKILEDRKLNKSKDIEDTETKNDLEDVGKICADVMDDLFEEENNEDIDGVDVEINKWIIIPTKIKINVGDKKYIYAYTSKNSLKAGLNKAELKIKKDDEKYLSIISPESEFTKSIRNKKLIYYKFQVEALEEKKGVEISVFHNNQIKTSGIIDVEIIKNREFKYDIEFEREEYKVKESKIRNINIYAKVPQIINSDTQASVRISNNEAIQIKGNTVFKLFKNTNYAIATMKVFGKKVGDRSDISLDLLGNYATTKIKVVKKNEEEPPESKFLITIEKRDFGKIRSTWNIENPNHLMIAGLHKQVNRYLGGEEKGFPGQKTPIFKCLLAEIISESMVLKRMTLLARHDPSIYKTIMDKRDITSAISDFNYRVEDEKNLFLEKIHERLVKNSTISEQIQKYQDALVNDL